MKVRPTATDRMRRWVANYHDDKVRITRDIADIDDMPVDPVTFALTFTDRELVWEGSASIQMPDQTRSREEIDRLEVKIDYDVEVQRHDVVEILQSSRDFGLLQTGVWYVIDVDYGTHHIQRKLICSRRNRLDPETPGPWSDAQ